MDRGSSRYDLAGLLFVLRQDLPDPRIGDAEDFRQIEIGEYPSLFIGLLTHAESLAEFTLFFRISCFGVRLIQTVFDVGRGGC